MNPTYIPDTFTSVSCVISSLLSMNKADWMAGKLSYLAAGVHYITGRLDQLAG